MAAAATHSKLKSREIGRIQPRFSEQGRIGHVRLATLRADQAHQALRQNTVEGRNKGVGIDAHVGEASQHIKHIVGVDGGEDQVPGQGRLDGNLGRF